MASSSRALALVPGEDRAWNDPNARLDKETFHLHEDDVSRFMDEAQARRQGRSQNGAASTTSASRYTRVSTRRRCVSWARISTSSSRETCSSSSRITSS